MGAMRSLVLLVLAAAVFVAAAPPAARLSTLVSPSAIVEASPAAVAADSTVIGYDTLSKPFTRQFSRSLPNSAETFVFPAKCSDGAVVAAPTVQAPIPGCSFSSGR